jgi:RNA polymerase sigma-70 factor (ECF subfamily)
VTDGPSGGPRRFATTRWSVVLATRDSDAAASRAALSDLCAAYWYPLYADARRRGAVSADAADLVQGFFAALIEKDWAADADPDRGRFRTFLVVAFRRFVSHEREKAMAVKRGGGAVLSLDVDAAESRLSSEPRHEATPERAFERRFALTLLARVSARVRAERPGDADLLPFVGEPGEERPYAEIAAARGSSEGAVKAAVHRLRAHWRDVLRAEVRETVAADSDVDDEIRHLMEMVAG